MILRFTVVASVCFVAGSLLALAGHEAVYGAESRPQISDDTAQTHPTTRPTQDDATVGLVQSLVRPYWKQMIAADWEDRLRRGRFHPGARGMGLDERDLLLARLAKAVVGRKPAVRVLVLEHIGGGLWQTMYYERIVLFRASNDAGAIKEAGGLGAIPVTERKWRDFEPHIAGLLKMRGGNNGVEAMSDAVNATVISYFDGACWRIETWFCIENPGEDDAVDSNGYLSAARTLYRLVKAVNTLEGVYWGTTLFGEAASNGK